MLDYTQKHAVIVKANKPLVDWLLSINTNNRTVKKKHVSWIKDCIDRKMFILTGQGIGVTSSGKLVDGQHRLMAVKEAGYPPVELLVVTGLSEDSQIYVDQHVKRSNTDMLQIVMNKSVSTNVTAIANYSLRLREGDSFTFRTEKPSLDTLVDYIAEHGELLDLIFSSCGKRVRAPIACAVFHYAQKYNVDKAVEFALQLRDGENISRTDPAYRLRDYIGNHTEGGNTASTRHYSYAVTACIAHAQGKQLSILKQSSSWENLPKAE